MFLNGNDAHIPILLFERKKEEEKRQNLFALFEGIKTRQTNYKLNELVKKLIKYFVKGFLLKLVNCLDKKLKKNSAQNPILSCQNTI